jgi:histidyl-tRNA synthetase
MRDVLAPESTRWRRFVQVFADTVEAAGYDQIIPPLLEDIGVFSRVGEATDVVSKEMYDFVDKGERHVALRPEQTASVCRAFVQHRPALPWKTWYTGPNFRYEKPQRGRYRQFDQVGIEVFGVTDPGLDVEVIALGWRFFATLGLRRVTLRLNSLGEPADRARFTAALHQHFSGHLGDLSAESRSTLERNPLRVYSDTASTHFDAVRAGLTALDIPFVRDERLVRGLDYYRFTTFEYAGGTLDSAQNALGGGGRYDGLVEDLGGPSTPGIGFALGLDRTLLACDDEGVFAATPRALDVFVVDTTGGAEAVVITDSLRGVGLSADRAFDGRSMKSQMKAADRSGARVAVIVGSDELAAATVVIRDLRHGADQVVVPRSDLVDRLRAIVSSQPKESS